MNPGTLTLAAKSVTIRFGTQAVTTSINPALIQSVIADGTGSKGQLFWGSQPQAFTSTDSPSTLLSGLPYIAVTVKGGVSTYIPTSMMRSWYTPASGNGTDINVLTNPSGQEYQLLSVTESKTAIDAAYAAVVASSSGGGLVPGSITATGTNQGTAAQTSTQIIRITGGAADTGIILDTALAGEWRVITNATTTRKIYYPASGENFTGMADNLGMSLQPNETVELYSSLATEWSRAEDTNVQSATGVGTTQGTGVAINANADVVLLNTAFGNTAATFAAALPGMKTRVVNVGASVGRLFPASGGTINGGAADAVYQLGAGRTAVLVCNVAGAWVDETTQINALAATTLYTITAAGTLTISDPVTGALSSFSSSTGIINSASLYLRQSAGTATAGGVQADATPVDANIFNVEVCATDGDSILISSSGNFTYVKNSGVADCWAYCPVGATMNGVTDGYTVIPPGETYVFYLSVSPNTWISFPAGETAQSLTATPAGTQGTSVKVRGSVVTLATVATALDGATIDPTSGLKEFILLNNAGVSASLFPPVGGTIDGGAVDAAFVVPRSATFLLTTTNGLDYFVKLLPGATQVASANAGSTQATGTPIVSPFVNCTVVATAGDSYTIQKYSPRRFAIWNRDSADALDLFPNVGGTINGGAVDAAFSIPAGVGFTVSSIDGSAWLVELLDGSAQSGTASAGSDQATGTAITSTTVNATTVATAGDSYTIQTWSPRLFRIWNRDATESLDLFPPVGGTIDGAAVDTAFAIPAGSGWILTSNDGATWLVELIPAATQTATANVGSTQATGTPIFSPSVTAATVANAGDSFTIRAWSPRWFEFFNNGANAADVFPPVGGTINGAAVDAAFSVAVGVGFRFSSNDGIAWTIALMQNARQVATANVGSTQATGEPIVSPTVNATTVANAGDAYSIQTYSPRLFQIWNRGANSLDLFPPVGGTINGGAADAAFAIPAGIGFKVVSNDGATWLVELLPGGSQVSTANVGSDQATGEPVVGSVECLVCANAGDSYTIQAWSPRFFHIRNSGANSLDLFPPVGGQVNGGGANVALAVAAAAAYLVYSNDGVLWYAVLQ